MLFANVRSVVKLLKRKEKVISGFSLLVDLVDVEEVTVVEDLVEEQVVVVAPRVVGN